MAGDPKENVRPPHAPIDGSPGARVEAPVAPGASSARDDLDLSLVIVNRNTRDLLEACLASIVSLPDRVRIEIIVIDNGSTDGSVELVESRFPGARLIRNDGNTGFAFPNNQGIAVSGGRYVMLLNSDTEVAPSALERLVEFMDAHPEAGACGPLLRYPDGRPQPSWLSFHSPWRCFTEMVGLGSLFPRSRLFANQERLFDPRSVAPVETLMGAALVVRREVIDSIGALDLRFSIHCNETDWCYRMKKAGWIRYFVPQAEVVHHLGGTLRRENEAFQLQGEMLGNLFDYYRKHYGGAGLAWYRFWTVVGFTARLAARRVGSLAGRSGERADRSAHLARVLIRAAWTGKPGGR